MLNKFDFFANSFNELNKGAADDSISRNSSIFFDEIFFNSSLNEISLFLIIKLILSAPLSIRLHAFRFPSDEFSTMTVFDILQFSGYVKSKFFEFFWSSLV